MVAGNAITSVHSPYEHGRGGNSGWDEKRELSEGEVAVWGYAGEAGMRFAGLWLLRRAGVADLGLR